VKKEEYLYSKNSNRLLKKVQEEEKKFSGEIQPQRRGEEYEAGTGLE